MRDLRISLEAPLQTETRDRMRNEHLLAELNGARWRPFVATISPPSPDAPSPSPKVLIVEDDADFRQALTLSLEATGFRVDSADSVQAALVSLRRAHFDVVVTDYGLGVGTGVEMLELASAERLLDGTAAIVCTAYRHVPAPAGALLLHKPVTLDDLLHTIALATAARGLEAGETDP